MKTAIKFVSGLFLATALMVGCGANANFNYHHEETKTTTDANGNTTTTSTTNDNGKTTTVNKMVKNLYFSNNTGSAITKLEIKTDIDSNYVEILNGSPIEADHYNEYDNSTINETVKSFSFRVTTADGQTSEIKDVSIAGIKNMKKPVFNFTQNGNTISTTLVEANA